MTKQTLYIIGAILVAGLLMFGAKLALSQEPKMECMSNEDFMSVLEEAGAYKAVFLHVMEDGNMEIAIDPDTKEWLLLATKGDVTCLVGDGVGYKFVERE